MQFSKANVFTIGKEKKIVKINDTPGMGQYNPKDKITKKTIPDFKLIFFLLSFSKTKKYNDRPSETPGPREYEIDVKKSQTPQYAFPKNKKESSIQDKISQSMSVPGPGNYNPKNENHNKKVGYTMTGKTSTKIEQMPGPGEYLLDKNQRASSSANFGNEKKKSPINEYLNGNVPGPGSYSTKNNNMSKTQTFR